MTEFIIFPIPVLWSPQNNAIIGFFDSVPLCPQDMLGDVPNDVEIF